MLAGTIAIGVGFAGGSGKIRQFFMFFLGGFEVGAII